MIMCVGDDDNIFEYDDGHYEITFGRGQPSEPHHRHQDKMPLAVIQQ